MKKGSAGFTMVELLITVTIIAILAAIGILSYQTVLKNSRDAKRKSDLNFIQSALEQYHGDQRYYPYTGSITSGAAFNNATGAPSDTAVSKVYLNNVPSDPTGTYAYTYKAYTNTAGTADCDSTKVSQCVKYCIYVHLDGASTDDLSGCSSLTNYNYAVTSP